MIKFKSNINIDPKIIEIWAKSLLELENKTWKWNDFLWWMDLPKELLESKELEKIQITAIRLWKISEIVVVVGIGGSYIGSKAIIDCFVDPFDCPKVVFAGNCFDEVYHSRLLNFLDKKNYSVIVISKSGTTLETKIAFEKILEHSENKYWKTQIKERFVTITDSKNWILRERTNKIWCESFVIPENIGGRYSVFTACGLLPIAYRWIDISKLLQWALEAQKLTKNTEYKDNLALQYACQRYNFYKKENKLTEIFVPFIQTLWSLWWRWQQLFGESDGKDWWWILPIFLKYSTDLHSMGQFVQDWPKNIFETFVWIENYESSNSLNSACHKWTLDAHQTWWIPILEWKLQKLDEYHIGQFLYFLMKSCAIWWYMLGINPFNQPWVENYKKAMKKYI